MPLPRLRGRGMRAPAAGLAIVLLLLIQPLPAAKATGESAADHYKAAKLLWEDLRAVPRFELGVEQYLLVINSFRRVYESSQARTYGDESLLAIATLYQEMSERFGTDPYREKALKNYDTLLNEYPGSALKEQAQKGIVQLGGKLPEETEIASAGASGLGLRTGEAGSPGGVTPGGARLRRASRSSRPPGGQPFQVQAVRFWSHPDYIRVIVEVEDEVDFKFDTVPSPDRLYVDLLGTKLGGELREAGKIEVGDPLVERIRLGQNQLTTSRVVFDLNSGNPYFDFSWLSNPSRLVIELRSTPPPRLAEVTETLTEPTAASENLLGKVSVPAAAEVTAKAEQVSPRPARFESQPAPATGAPAKRSLPASPAPEVKLAHAGNPIVLPETARLRIPKPPQPEEAAPQTPAPPASAKEELQSPKAASATSLGNRNLIRALGLKLGRVVVDPGHGGHDTGGIGASGLREKDLVLDVSLRLGQMLRERLGAEVVFTRTDDTFVSLRKRTLLANQRQADLFISVHANSSRAKAVRGVETYYLNFTTDRWAMAVASRENAASEQKIHELRDLVSKIALKEKVEESREFAAKVQQALYKDLSKETRGLRNRGVRKAPFMVLIGAQMPAVLAEVGFISNTRDEKLLKASSYRQKVAEGIYQGVADYADTLSSVTVAQK